MTRTSIPELERHTLLKIFQKLKIQATLIDIKILIKSIVNKELQIRKGVSK